MTIEDWGTTPDHFVCCPWCGGRIRLFTGVGQQDPPDPGDFAICAGCLQIGIFQPSATGLILRRANAWESEVLMTHPDIRAARMALQRNETAEQAAEELRSRDDLQGPSAGG